MSKPFYSLLFAAITCLILNACSSKIDSVKEAKLLSDQKTPVDSEMSHFLIDAVNDRRMEYNEGMLATERGTTSAIRHYGELIVRDQAYLLGELKIIAACRKVQLPESLSNKKSKLLTELREKQGEEFDKKFIKMITKDHERALRQFEKAGVMKDRYIRIFAKRYAYMIQSHLDQLEKLKAQSDQNSGKLTSVVSN